jgi:O-methyltransferase
MSKDFSDVHALDVEIINKIQGYTMTSIERQLALISATRYILSRNIDGCFVECGVWRGGSSMATALTLMQQGISSRDIYLYDTFEGMTPPTRDDTLIDGTPAQALLESDPEKSGIIWAVAGLDDVKHNLSSTGYPKERLNFIQGPVETTLPDQRPDQQIALLRLDTDWYESTQHELVHLFPMLAKGGILIIDDYGHWQGARKAVDDYLEALPQPHYLHRIDYTGRLLIKDL